MTRERRLRREQARRALFDLQELVVDVLEENPDGLEPGQIARELEILAPQENRRYPGGSAADIVWGILHGLVDRELVEKVGSRAILSSGSSVGN